jgi:hypothetical protein
MPDNNQLATSEATHGRSRRSQIIPVAVLCALALAAAMNAARGKNNQPFEGVVVMDYPRFIFYPQQKDCQFTGTAYWLVPNHGFYDAVPMPSAPDFESALHAAWKVKLRGNLSPIGRYGIQGKYWRELDVLYAMDAKQLDCKDNNVGSIR